MAIDGPEALQISVVGPLRRCMTRDSLQARTGLHGFCTVYEITFFGSTHPQLPFDMSIDLAETRYHGDR